MSVSMRNEFQISATPGEELSRHLAYLAAQDNGSVLTGGFIKEAATLEREGSDRAGQQGVAAMEFLARQEQLRQQRLAELSSRFDALEQAAHDALIDAKNDLAEILSNANRDRNGRAVFQDHDGNIRNEDGEIVDPAEVDISELDSDTPTWEDLEATLSRRELAAEGLERVTEAREQWESSDQEAADLNQWDADLDALKAAILNNSQPTEAAEAKNSANLQQPLQSDGLNQTASSPLPGQSL